jgi:hypothetical protein
VIDERERKGLFIQVFVYFTLIFASYTLEPQWPVAFVKCGIETFEEFNFQIF